MAFMVTNRNRYAWPCQARVTQRSGNISFTPPVNTRLSMSQPVRPTFDKIKARAIMDAAGKSYADLGRALDIERQAVGHWFRDRGEPTVRQMKEMAKELGCHWLELVDENAMVVYAESERQRLERMRSLSPEALAKLDAYIAVETAT